MGHFLNLKNKNNFIKKWEQWVYQLKLPINFLFLLTASVEEKLYIRKCEYYFAKI